MYAIVETGGKQYRVEAGDVLTIEKLEAGEGETVALGRVLLLGGGGEPVIGTPVVEGAIVNATVLEHGRDKKKIIFRYKNKNRYKVKKGHRQPHTRVRIDAILQDGQIIEEAVYEEEALVAEVPVEEPLSVEPDADVPESADTLVEEMADETVVAGVLSTSNVAAEPLEMEAALEEEPDAGTPEATAATEPDVDESADVVDEEV